MSVPYEKILGFSIFNQGLDHCLDQIFKSIKDNESKQTWLCCINPHSYNMSLSDKLFKKSLLSSNWLVPDGIGIVYASRFLGGIIKNRITGSDIFYGLNSILNNCGTYSVFFLGSSDETLELMSNRFKLDYPRIRLAGTFSPPYKSHFSEEDISVMTKAINKSKADILWVGLSAPKQEKWIQENIMFLDIKFAGAIGAVFDFYSGKINRANTSFQKVGLEWLPRLIQEPKRLYKRIFISAPIFIWHVLIYRKNFNR